MKTITEYVDFEFIHKQDSLLQGYIPQQRLRIYLFGKMSTFSQKIVHIVN